MKMSEILRSLADKLASIEQGQDQPQTTKSMGGTPVATPEPELDDKPVMVPPLQQKLELLKKASGVDNVYDSEEPDELDDIKKLTGIKAVIAQEAGDDEPLDN
jgi:hypothetical protein